MKKLNWLIILLIAAASFVASCKKDKEDTCSFTEANFAGSYKIESIKYKVTPTSPEIDGTFLLDACELDDVTTFNTSHTYTYTDAGTACDPNGDDNGTWSVSGSILTIDGELVTVDNFSCAGFSISQTDFDTQGDKATLTFKKQ